MERRPYLRALGGLGALALAGCIDAIGGPDDPGTDDPTPTPGETPRPDETPTPGGTATPDESTPTPDESAPDETPTPDDSTQADTPTPADGTPTPDGSSGDASGDGTPTPDGSSSDDGGGSTGEQSARTLSIYDYPGPEPARYEFTVSGDLAQTDGYGATVDDHDTVDGSTARGHVWGMMDSYRFTGEILAFEVSRRVKVVVDGEAVDPDDL